MMLDIKKPASSACILSEKEIHPGDDGHSLETRSQEFADATGLNEDRNGSLHRSFTPHQVHVISLGCNIGSGLFIGTGKALSRGGPGSMVLAYFLVSTTVWAMLQTLSEMTIMFPTSGSFVDYTARWVDPSLAFGAGFAEWLGWTAVVASEATFSVILIRFWSGDSIPNAALLTIFLVLASTIFLLPNRAFACFEYVMSLVKVYMFLLVIIVSLAIVGGAGSHGYVHHGETWTELPVFKNGFKGFAECAVLAIWAMGDQIFVGIMGGEAESPRYSMAHAAKLIPSRVATMYILCTVFITLLVPSDDNRLLGGSGAAASPYIISMERVGIPVVPHILNAGILIGVLAAAAESIYVSSRMLRTMAHQQLIPEFLAKVDDRGRPRWALGVTGVVAIILTYLNLSAGGIVALNWFVNITSSSELCNWFIVGFVSFRFRGAIKSQGDTQWSEPYAWKSLWWPLGPAWLILTSTLYLVGCLYCGLTGEGDVSARIQNFFEYTIGLVLVGFASLAYKLTHRTKWQKLATADCSTGRHVLSVEEIVMLDDYYKQSRWRRLGQYLRPW